MIHVAKKSMGLKKFSKENFSSETSLHKAKKSLGQNFLKSKDALRKMCEAGEVNDKDIILEIGPGKGALTESLLEKGAKVFAVEKDRDLIDFLSEKFESEIKSGKFILINDDILNFEINNIISKPNQYKLIANIPYNITGAIFKKFLSSDFQPERMVLLVQKEVEERVVATDGKESILSLSVKAYGTPKYILKVHKRFFSPSPKVDSAIVAITNISKNNFKNKDEEDNFFRVVRTGFAHKRKVLRKNLEILENNPHQVDEIFEKLGINPKTRAEDVDFGTWLKISQYLSLNS